MNRNNKELIVGTITVTSGIAILLVLPNQIPGESIRTAMDPTSLAFMPVLSTSLYILCGLALLLRAGFHRLSRATKYIDIKSVADENAITDNNIAVNNRVQIYKPVLMSFLLIFYLFLIWLIGSFAATAISVGLLSIAFGCRNKVTLLILSIITPLLIYILFQRLLLVLLPQGVLFI